MTIDEAIDELSDFLYSDCYLDAPSDEAIKVALSALHEKNAEFEMNVPLAIGELFRSNYEPIWIQDLENEKDSQWRICYVDLGKYFCSQGGKTSKGYLIQEYGKTWRAYRRQVV